MGQAQSLKKLESTIEANFSSNVLVSHGLFRSPDPGGSFVVCELDSPPAAKAKEGPQKNTKFVVQVIDVGNAQERLEGEGDVALLQPANDSTGSPCVDELSGYAVGSPPDKYRTADATATEVRILRFLAALAPTLSIRPASYMALENVLTTLECRGLGDCEYQSFMVSQNKDDDLSCWSKKDRHPNTVPLLGAFNGKGVIFLVYPHLPYTLRDILDFSPDALGGDEPARLLSYQLLSGLAHFHDQGVVYGDLKPSNILLTGSLWCLLAGPQTLSTIVGFNIPRDGNEGKCNMRPDSLSLGRDGDGVNLQRSDWRTVFRSWWRGHLSNYGYLLFLNRIAGRRWGDRCFHPVMPWVIDFSLKPDESLDAGWRDLTKSKWRLAKGDEQLDFTYVNADVPHHVSDECLSELAVCIYKARRLHLGVLRQVVRSVYEPNEYPATMNRLYQWTPDECIPEFYSDPEIFSSVHPGMTDLAVPIWAKDANDFVSLHYAALESDRVSRQLHHWIDLTFGYKLSGEAAVTSKNVPLSSSALNVPRSSGRRQLFSRPHPARQQHKHKTSSNESDAKTWIRHEERLLSADFSSAKNDQERQSSGIHINTDYAKFMSPLEFLESALTFCEENLHQTPVYMPSAKSAEVKSENSVYLQQHWFQSAEVSLDVIESRNTNSPFSRDPDILDLEKRLKLTSLDDGNFYDGLASWSARGTNIQAFADDIFAAGCIIAEIYLRMPLFETSSAAEYAKTGTLPSLMERIPLHVQPLVRAAIHPDFSRRPSARMLLNSSFFSDATRSAYRFLSPLQVLGPQHCRLEYVASMAEAKVFQELCPLAVEMCAPPVLSVFTPPERGINAGSTVNVLRFLLRALELCTAIELLLPVVRQLLLSQECVELKVALLQPSFIRELRRTVGTHAYMKYLHFPILTNLHRSPERSSAAAASTVLISICRELGVPVTLHQMVSPLLQCFGRDITIEGIEVLVGIGKRLGEQTVVKHLLPPLLALLSSGAEMSITAGSAQSWGFLAMLDAISALDRLIVVLSPTTLILELLEELSTLYVDVLVHVDSNPNLAQCAAKALLSICEHAGPEATAAYVLPRLNQCFERFASIGESFNIQHVHGKDTDSSRSSLFAANDREHQTVAGSKNISVLYILYPSLASLLGIERLRQCIRVWLLLEQILNQQFNWKGEGDQNEDAKAALWAATYFIPDLGLNPANLLLDGVGWSVPQSKARKWSKDSIHIVKSKVKDETLSSDEGTWFWVPSSKKGWKGGEGFSNSKAGLGLGGDKYSWELNAAIIHPWRAHNGPIRAMDVADDENMVLTGGRGSKGASCVRLWKLATAQCVLEYENHEETIHDVNFLKGGDRIASCDGSLHIWNRNSAERIFCFSESTGLEIDPRSSSGAADIRIPGPVISGNGAGSSSFPTADVYRCMHYMPAEDRILTGTAKGCLRFIDVTMGQPLFSWRCDISDATVSSYMSTIASSGVKRLGDTRLNYESSSWIAVGYSTGNCKLLDYRSGSLLASWKAHDGLITKLRAFDEYSLISSSVDKTLCLWDLRRGLPLQAEIFRGHTEGVTSFANSGNDLLSVAGNKIGLSSLGKVQGERPSHTPVQAKALGRNDRSGWSRRNLSVISVLPYSHYLLVGTEDGKLKVCT